MGFELIFSTSDSIEALEAQQQQFIISGDHALEYPNAAGLADAYHCLAEFEHRDWAPIGDRVGGEASDKGRFCAS